MRFDMAIARMALRGLVAQAIRCLLTLTAVPVAASGSDTPAFWSTTASRRLGPASPAQRGAMKGRQRLQPR